MKPPKGNWPDRDTSQGVLFFAQVLRQAISPAAFESFRAMTLDAPMRMQEVNVVLSDVEKGLPRATLEPVLAELLWCTEHDPAIQHVSREHIPSIKRMLSDQKAPPSDIRNIVAFLRNRSTSYKSDLEREILNSIPNPRDRVNLRTATSVYCSHLICRGYDREHIAHIIQRHFFNEVPSRVSLAKVTSFLKEFADEEERRYIVYARCGKPFAKHLENINYDKLIRLADLPPHVREAMAEEDVGPGVMFLCEPISAKDPHRAARFVQIILQNIKSIALIASQGVDFSWSNKFYVTTPRSKYGQFVNPVRAAAIRARRASGGRDLERVQQYTRTIFTSFSQKSLVPLMKSIDTAVSALASAEASSKMIGTWSAFEILLSDPAAEGPRIAHYLKLLVPALCLNYVNLLAAALFEELSIHYKDDFSQLVLDFGDANQSGPRNLVQLILLGDDTEGQRQLMALLRGNPLARHRLWKFGDDFGSPVKAKQAIEMHEKRVTWQIGRIYRARNSMVHGGAEPPFLEGLQHNAAEYYRYLVRAILDRASRTPRRSEVDHIVTELSIEYLTKINQLGSARRDQAWSDQTLSLLSIA